MEAEGSTPNSQEFSTCSYPEPDQISRKVQAIIKMFISEAGTFGYCSVPPNSETLP
jgi:hypothetical protein